MLWRPVILLLTHLPEAWQKRLVNDTLYVNYFHVNKHYFFRMLWRPLILLLLTQLPEAWQKRLVNDTLYVNYFHVNKHYFFRMFLVSRLVSSWSHPLVPCQGEERYVNVNLYVNYFHVNKRYFFRLRPQPVVGFQPSSILLTWQPHRLLQEKLLLIREVLYRRRQPLCSSARWSVPMGK